MKETTAKKVETYKSPYKDKKYKVIPGMSITGKQLQQRIRNRTILPKTQEGYTLEEEVTRARKLDKVQLHDKMNKTAKEAESLRNKLNHNQ